MNGSYFLPNSDLGNGPVNNGHRTTYYENQRVKVNYKPRYFPLPNSVGFNMYMVGSDEFIETHNDYQDDDEEDIVLPLPEDLISTSKGIKEIAQSQKNGIGLEEDNEPRDGDNVSEVSQDSNMSFQTDGDPLTEKDITEIFGDDDLKDHKIQTLYMKIHQKYPSIVTYVERIDKARLQSITSIKTLLEKIEEFETNPSKANIEKQLAQMVNGYRKDGDPTIRKQPTLLLYVITLEKKLSEKQDTWGTPENKKYLRPFGNSFDETQQSPHFTIDEEYQSPIPPIPMNLFDIFENDDDLRDLKEELSISDYVDSFFEDNVKTPLKKLLERLN